MDDITTLRINTEKLGDIRDVIRYLIIFEKAYNHLYAFDLIVQDAKKKHKELNTESYSYREKSVRSIISIRKPEEVILPEDRLRISSVVIKSPGFWEFLGNMNPLEVLRKYLCDRHERNKDIAYRNQHEKEKNELKNEKLRMDVVQEKIDILKKIGVPEEKIRKTVFNHVVQPLSELDDAQDKGLLEDAKLVKNLIQHDSGEEE